MTTTDERQQLIEFARRGLTGQFFRAVLVCLLFIIGVPLVIKTLDDKHRSSVAARRAALASSADASPVSNCSGKLDLTSIWLAIGCANSPAPAQPR